MDRNRLYLNVCTIFPRPGHDEKVIVWSYYHTRYVHNLNKFKEYRLYCYTGSPGILPCCSGSIQVRTTRSPAGFWRDCLVRRLKITPIVDDLDHSYVYIKFSPKLVFYFAVRLCYERFHN